MATPKRKPIPQYKQPLPAGLTKAQKLVELQKRVKTAQRVSKKGSKIVSHTRNPEVRLSDWIRLNKSNLIRWTQSRFQRNQIVAEELSRIIFEIEEGRMNIPPYQHPTFRAIFDRLSEAEGSRKEISLTPQQITLLEKFSGML